MSGHSASVGGRQADLVSLRDDERVLGNVVFYWTNWWTQIVFAILIFFFGLVLVFVGGGPAILGFSFIVFSLVILFLTYRAKEKSGCLVTNKRIVLSKAGLVSNQTKEVRMNDIKSIITSQSGTQSVLGRGSVRVKTGAGEISIGAGNINELAEVIRREKNRQAGN